MNLLFNKFARVISVEKLFEDYYVLYASIPKVFKWRPSQVAMLKIPGKDKGKKWRIMSIASTMKEAYYSFATRVGSDSPFKNQVKSIKVGDKLHLRGPFKGVRFEKNANPDVFVVLGIGITPINGYLSGHADTKKENNGVYSAKTQYIFKADLDRMAAANPNIKIHYLKNRIEIRSKLEGFAKKHPQANYYLTVSPSAMLGVKNHLHNLGSKKDAAEKFKGYES